MSRNSDFIRKSQKELQELGEKSQNCEISTWNCEKRDFVRLYIMQLWVYISQFWIYIMQLQVYIKQFWSFLAIIFSYQLRVYIMQFWLYDSQLRVSIVYFDYWYIKDQNKLKVVMTSVTRDHMQNHSLTVKMKHFF